MTETAIDGYHEIEDKLFVGSCPTCGLRYNGAEHICPGELTSNKEKDLLNMQHVDEPIINDNRMYGERLADGFDLLSDSW